jgi:hypothetical protein
LVAAANLTEAWVAAWAGITKAAVVPKVTTATKRCLRINSLTLIRSGYLPTGVIHTRKHATVSLKQMQLVKYLVQTSKYGELLAVDLEHLQGNYPPTIAKAAKMQLRRLLYPVGLLSLSALRLPSKLLNKIN